MIAQPIGKVSLPRYPVDVLAVKYWAKDVQKCLRELAERQFDIVPGYKDRNGNGDAWRLSTSMDGTNWKWYVSSWLSSITDGTNGDLIPLADIPGLDEPDGTSVSATSWIVLEADVDPSLNLTGWTAIATTDDTEIDEVGFDEEDPTIQTKLRLLIGKIVIDTGDPPQAHFLQFRTTPVMITVGICNGVAVKLFQEAPLHCDYTDPE